MDAGPDPHEENCGCIDQKQVAVMCYVYEASFADGQADGYCDLVGQAISNSCSARLMFFPRLGGTCNNAKCILAQRASVDSPRRKLDFSATDGQGPFPGAGEY